MGKVLLGTIKCHCSDKCRKRIELRWDSNTRKLTSRGHKNKDDLLVLRANLAEARQWAVDFYSHPEWELELEPEA